LTAVGEIEISQTRFGCAIDAGQYAYPLQGFIGLIGHKVALSDGSTEIQTIKCTRNAAASIALVCSESSYEQSALVLSRLAGLDLSTMTEFRVTNCVAAEFVNDVPAEIDVDAISEAAKKIGGSILEVRVNQLNVPDVKGETDKIIQKALKDGPDGVFHKDYNDAKIKVMYIMADGTGVPGIGKELAGARGKQPDGSAKTFEAKIGTVFTVEYTADGKPLLTENGEIFRNKDVRYMGTVRKADDFGAMLYKHAVDNGLRDVDCVVFLGDGAKWLWNIQKEFFPYALTGIDLYHAIERVNAMADLLQFKGRTGSGKKQAVKDECIELLRYGKVKEMLDLIESVPCKKGNEKKLAGAKGYFLTNMDRMNYGAFAACGIFVGSGVVEAGCKVIVGNRMKNAGMHWSRENAENMISLRCAIRNDDFLGKYLNNSEQFDKAA
jgi:hypothetical protein